MRHILFWAIIALLAPLPGSAHAQGVGEGSLLAQNKACAPGARSTCQCPNGAWGSQTCDPLGLLSLCACGSAAGGFGMPDFSSWSQPKPKRRSKRSSGQGMLIGGIITLSVGTGSLIGGIVRIDACGADPLGIVLTATGGTAMAVGLPLTIVGIVLFATRGDSRGMVQGSVPTWEGGPELHVSGDGAGLSF